MTGSAPPDPNVQDKVFGFLSSLTTDPPVRRIDTHAASVFLAGERALKVKRAVRFAFLDYSTLEKRKAACEAEMRVNRPFAPQIYRGVVPITQEADGSLRIAGEGTPVEYAIDMARFDESQTIDHLAEAGPLEADLVDRIADAIVASHAGAALAATAPWVESIPSLIAGNTAAFRAKGNMPGHRVDELDAASRSAFERLRERLQRRGDRGQVRHCHGDLHLGNIVLIARQPVLFDAIEFDPAMASIDVLYDLAFPLMEFLRYRHDAAANLLLNRYLATTGAEHPDGLAALPLFMSVRSAIRAKVLNDRLAQDGADKAGIAAKARAYFDLALRLIHPPAPTLVAVGGLSGTGKSVLARALAAAVAPAPGAVVLRSDIVRKQQFDAAETDRLPASAYRQGVTQQVYDELARRARDVLAQGHSVIVDGVFARPAERAAIADIAHELKIPFIGLFLTADLATRVERVRRRAGDASDATPEIAELQEGYQIGAIDWALIDASGTPAQTLETSTAELVNSSHQHLG